MPMVPEDWSVVCAGRWNAALFTPGSIAKRVFDLPEGTPLEVSVALDEPLPPRLTHQGLTISASMSRLSVEIDPITFEQLDRAKALAAKMIEQLPNTPVVAVGVNVRYRADTLPDSIVRRFSDDLDGNFGEGGCRVIGRSFRRVVEDGKGHLQVSVSSLEGEKAQILLNFEKRSKESSELSDWLAYPIASVEERVAWVMEEVLGVLGGEYVRQGNG